MACTHTHTQPRFLSLRFSVFLWAFTAFVACVVAAAAAAVVFGCFVQLVTVWVTISFLLLCSLSVLFWLATATSAADVVVVVAAQI